jgi:uncharacterized protein (DUF488 family)
MWKVATIGVYGFTEDAFFQALEAAQVDVFCDVRQRRSVRGAAYAFANSQRLQKRLAELGIRYLYRKDVAPTTAVRRQQQEADKSDKVAKRQRTGLSPAFVEAYRQEVLDLFEPPSLLEELPPDTAVVALFCVEREPTACHRSLLAEKLAAAWEVEVEHIYPEERLKAED